MVLPAPGRKQARVRGSSAGERWTSRCGAASATHHDPREKDRGRSVRTGVPRLKRATREIGPLTAIRGFAALWVVGHHLVPAWYPNATGWVPTLFLTGYAAVDVFFVLSGFILATVYRDLATSETPMFLLKRLCRVYPLHLCIMAALVAAALVSSLSGGSVSKPWGQLPWVGLMLQSYVLSETTLESPELVRWRGAALLRGFFRPLCAVLAPDSGAVADRESLFCLRVPNSTSCKAWAALWSGLARSCAALLASLSVQRWARSRKASEDCRSGSASAGQLSALAEARCRDPSVPVRAYRAAFRPADLFPRMRDGADLSCPRGRAGASG